MHLHSREEMHLKKQHLLDTQLKEFERRLAPVFHRKVVTGFAVALVANLVSRQRFAVLITQGDFLAQKRSRLAELIENSAVKLLKEREKAHNKLFIWWQALPYFQQNRHADNLEGPRWWASTAQPDRKIPPQRQERHQVMPVTTSLGIKIVAEISINAAQVTKKHPPAGQFSSEQV